MKPRYASVVAALTATAVLVLAVRPAISQIQVAPAFVRLQAATPGAPQSGHSNITGTAIAGQFQGGGAALTGLNAGNVASGTLADARLSANVPLKNGANVFTSSNQFNGFVGINRSNVITSAEVFGIQGPATGFGGMYISSTGATALPFYGYSLQGSAIAYHYLDGSDSNKWKLYNSGSFLTFTAAGELGVGTTTPASKLDVLGTAQMTGFKMPTGAGAGFLLTSDANGNGVWQASAGVPNPLLLTGSQAGPVIKGSNSSVSSSASGVFGECTAASGVSNGVFGQNSSTAGTGVQGNALATTGFTNGGRFVSNSTSGTGVYGFAQASTGSTIGVSGRSDSTTGMGVYGRAAAVSGFTYGMYGTSPSTNGTGVFGECTALTGITYGGDFRNSSSSGYGVLGDEDSSTGTTYGVYGLCWSNAGTGVVGNANSGSGTTYGVYGQCASATGYGVYAAGRTGASGTKSFRIDHPFDPENKYLMHYSTEGPEPMNFYSGIVATDNRGYAQVELPSYYSSINKDARIQLTVVDEKDSDSFVMAKVVELVHGNTFRIRTSAPKTKVFWRLEAVRNDRWVQQYGAPVEVDKVGRERGTYQHPELYGKPESMGMNYRGDLTSGEQRRLSRP